MGTSSKNKKYTKLDIKQMLYSNNQAVLKAVVAIYNLQDDFEQTNMRTVANNKVGYNIADARIMSQYALKIKSCGMLDHEEFMDAKSRILKYTRQLKDIANKFTPIQYFEEGQGQLKMTL